MALERSPREQRDKLAGKSDVARILSFVQAQIAPTTPSVLLIPHDGTTIEETPRLSRAASQLILDCSSTELYMTESSSEVTHPTNDGCSFPSSDEKPSSQSLKGPRGLERFVDSLRGQSGDELGALLVVAASVRIALRQSGVLPDEFEKATADPQQAAPQLPSRSGGLGSFCELICLYQASIAGWRNGPKRPRA